MHEPLRPFFRFGDGLGHRSASVLARSCIVKGPTPSSNMQLAVPWAPFDEGLGRDLGPFCLRKSTLHLEIEL